jgi:hypothetical protein
VKRRLGQDHAVRSRTYVYWLLGLPLLAACSEQPASAPPQPVATQPVDKTLPPLQLARLEYTFQAAELTQRDWPAMTPRDTCLLLVEPELQWVINCDEALPGFERTPQRFRDRPIYVHAATGFDSGGQLHSTAELLATTPAAAQVPAGKNVQRALPGEKPWLVVGSLEALTLFHPAFDHATTEAWVSVVIHELVHTHQLRVAGAERFVDAIVSLQRSPAALTELFVGQPRFHALIEREYALLSRAAQSDPEDKRAARRALRQWLTLYQQRIDSLAEHPRAKQLIADDVLFSYLEGVARHVESQFLREPSLHPPMSLDADPRFDHYRQFLGRGYVGSPNRQLDEHYFYAIGYHLCVLLDRLDTGWRTRVHTRDRFLYDLVRELAASEK